MTNQNILRQQLVQLLSGRNAHMSFEDAVNEFPMELINTQPPNVPYTFWHLIEHLRIAQWDILDFIKNPNYIAPDWPTGYWPETDSSATPEGWTNSVSQFLRDRKELVELVQNPNIDLFSDLEHAPGYTVLREIIVVADHNAYHIGELGILRQVMSAWPQKES